VSPDIEENPAIELGSLRKVFPGRGGEVVAVDRIDLRVNRGEVVAFLGPNGAGKTTTLDMVLGLTRPTSGTVRVHGMDPRRAVRAGRVSAVLQSGGLVDDLTVRETVDLMSSFHAHHQGVDEVIERAGLGELRNRRVLKCSGGEQQLLRFALALLPDPELLVLDEPTAGMDVAARREFWEVMHADAEAGRTVVFATHYLAEAEDFARRIVMVADGRVAADGTTAELRSLSSARQVAADVDRELADELSRRLTDQPGVQQVEAAESENGPRLQVRCTDSDAVARLLLQAGARELEVSRGSLDQTFLDLTEHQLDNQLTADGLAGAVR